MWLGQDHYLFWMKLEGWDKPWCVVDANDSVSQADNTLYLSPAPWCDHVMAAFLYSLINMQ